MRTAFVIALALALASALVTAAAIVRADEPSVLASASASAPVSVSATSSRSEVAEARAQIDATLAQMRAVSLRVRVELRATRKRGTKQQITCVDEALSRSDVALRHARDLGDEVLTAYAGGDTGAARAARHRLRELREAQRLASLDAGKCVPALMQLALASTTSVKLDVDPRIPPAP